MPGPLAGVLLVVASYLVGAIPWPAKVRARILDPVSLDVRPGLESYNRRAIAESCELIRARLQLELDKAR